MHDKKEATTEYAKMWLLIKKIVATNINAIHFVSHHLANNSYHSLHFYTRSEVFLRFYAIINLNLPSVLDKSPHSLGWIALVRHLDVLIPAVLQVTLNTFWYVIYVARADAGKLEWDCYWKLLSHSIVCMLTHQAKCPT